MKKSFKLLSVLACIIILSTVFTGCVDDESAAPSEQELAASGLSLITALPEFGALQDNYTFKRKIWQTNGEDFFDYSLVRLDGGDIFVRPTHVHNNTGWQVEEEAFTYDSANANYEIYAKNSAGNYTAYRKFKYNDTDEEFTKYSYSYDVGDNNTKANSYRFDLSYFSGDFTSYFEYYEFIDQYNAENKVWRVKQDKLADSAVINMLSAFKIEITDGDRIDYVYFYVKDNKISKVLFNYWEQEYQFSFRIETTFDYNDYQFDTAALTSGFTPYIPE